MSRIIRAARLAVAALTLAIAAQAQPAKTITEENCTASVLGESIPVNVIGEPVSAVTLHAPQWRPEAGANPAYCYVEGSMAPVDTSPTARPIRFAVALPASWTFRSAQMGGGGMNGSIPPLAGGPGRAGPTFLQRGFATYGSDSGHPAGRANEWALNMEAIANLGYMQMKKTHDAAMVLIQRAYGQRPRYRYYFGGSQGGREALTVAQRYPADYDGISAEVPIVNFSSLMLGPVLVRIQEKPVANWVTPAKTNAIRAEFMRQCDKLDGLVDGVINNYMACRALFDVKQGAPGRDPWAAKRCPDDKDPNPQDSTAAACLTSGQIATLNMVYSRYPFATPLANGVRTFGMWLPGNDPSGSGLIAAQRFRGQEGAAADAPMFGHLGILGVTGFLMQNLEANPLDYVEGGPLNKRRVELSAILDSTNPDLSAFRKRGGKLIVVIGTADTLASPGAQLDYYQSVIDKMGQAPVDEFARFWVVPQGDHGLGVRTAPVDGDGSVIPVKPIPSAYDRVGLLTAWVENKQAPGRHITATARDGSGHTLPLCSYPAYPKYVSGPASEAGSYTCAVK